MIFASASFCSANSQADRLGDEGVDLIKKGHVDDGIALLKSAVEADPENPSWHMNYGSILFEVGRKMVQQGQKEASRPLLADSENELFKATRFFKRNDALQMAQCYFLIGDLYAYSHNQKDIAKTYYQKSLEYDPRHEGALNAMKDLTIPKE